MRELFFHILNGAAVRIGGAIKRIGSAPGAKYSELKREGGFVVENRLFLLYFPGYFDGDEIIGIYDDIQKRLLF